MSLVKLKAKLDNSLITEYQTHCFPVVNSYVTIDKTTFRVVEVNVKLVKFRDSDDKWIGTKEEEIEVYIL